MFLEYDDLGQPMGDWEHDYGKHLGRCALKININFKSYRLVPEGDKQIFWHETKTRKPPKYGAHLMPWDVYKGFITKEDWKKFEADRMTDEAKAVSERARKNSKQNKHHHHLGQKSYKRSKEQWIKDGRYPTDTKGSLSDRIAKRGLDWILAREVPGEGGTWVITNDDTRKVAEKYEDYTQQQIQGTFVPERNVDALCMALGKEDHNGRVYGVGGLNIGLRKAFGKPEGKGCGLNRSRQSMEVIKESIKASLKEEFEQRLEDQVTIAVKRQWASMMQQMGGLTFPEGTSLPQTTNSDPSPQLLKASKACHLAVWDAYSGDKVVVAGGIAYPNGDGSIMPDHMKVKLNDPYTEFCDIELPLPTEEGATTVGEAHGSFVQWPEALVLFEHEEATSEKKKKCKGKCKEKVDSSGLESGESEPAANHKGPLQQIGDNILDSVGEKSKCKEKIDSSGLESGESESAANLKGPLQQIGDDILDSVGEKSKFLHYILASQPERYDVMTVQLDTEVLHLEKDVEIFVTAEDIALLLRGERLNISMIQVFIMFLVDKYNSSLDVSHIGFLCPQTIAASTIRDDHQATTAYLKDFFLFSRDRGDAGCKLILAPYYEEEHWILLVINVACGKVFKFDSSRPKKERSLAIKDSLDRAYSVYKVQGRKGRGSKLKWFSIECAKQTVDTECGYYVMKFMHEIITSYKDCQNLEKEYQRRDEPYNDEEIDEVREQWAAFFTKYLYRPM
ncbi:hypothetical protein BVRB_4g091570 [Beta vulgaris subsp. vulgaris]|nr:hypothetical protein BVRB_4g091570 [Beta vulgaris subsp. vulgaris]